MIDKIIEILGSIPKKKRRMILRFIDITTWVILIIGWGYPLPIFLYTLNFVVCFVMFCVSIQLIQIGGWWWTDDNDYYDR